MKTITVRAIMMKNELGDFSGYHSVWPLGANGAADRYAVKLNSMYPDMHYWVEEREGTDAGVNCSRQRLVCFADSNGTLAFSDTDVVL